ncbi:30S ribosomal protein S5 [Candidatus Cyrtobacter comes]|uniref:Small ribosomal subunit protein uS5 n=1 Tax=Candidatus Cyrtobacter comes TaxID=675776 RepID=A0ABU5L7F3_9RICK|nr:30S ribosomal protein S5 [Candidatus Cyrtobacter comes]MDZ5761739.1 30S ribosomal protein S5 [Candidatus Cyrtobacter comes]
MLKASKSNNSDISEKLVHVARCTKVVKGGRRFSFSVMVAAGDGKGKIGIGFGKASELADSMEKASRLARVNMIKIPMKDGKTLHHEVCFKFCSARVKLKPAPSGTGIIAGGPLRSILELWGAKDIVAKSIGSTNPHNYTRAAIDGIKTIRSPRYIAAKRGKKVAEVFTTKKSKRG